MGLASKGDFKSVVRLLFESGCNIPQAYQRVDTSKSNSKSEDVSDKDPRLKVISLGSVSSEMHLPHDKAVVKASSMEIPSSLSQTPTRSVLAPSPVAEPAKSTSPIVVENDAANNLPSEESIISEPAISSTEQVICLSGEGEVPIQSSSPDKSDSINVTPALDQTLENSDAPAVLENKDLSNSEIAKEIIEEVVEISTNVEQNMPKDEQNLTTSTETLHTELNEVKSEIDELKEEIHQAENVSDMEVETVVVNAIEKEVEDLETMINEDTVTAEMAEKEMEDVKIELVNVERTVDQDMLTEIMATLAHATESLEIEQQQLVEEIIEEQEAELEEKQDDEEDHPELEGNQTGFSSVLRQNSEEEIATMKISLSDVPDSDDD